MNSIESFLINGRVVFELLFKTVCIQPTLTLKTTLLIFEHLHIETKFAYRLLCLRVYQE